MGLMDFIKGGVAELAIARPDHAKGLLVWKHQDPTIPNKAQLTVGTDEVALFFKDGQFVGKVGAGRHTLETTNIMFLNRLIDKFTGGNVFKAEVWFVTTREVAGFKFGGRIGKLKDPKSQHAIETMVHGTYSLQITDPEQAIGFFGQRSWSTDDEFAGWFRDQLVKTIRDRIASLMVKKGTDLLEVTSGALTEEIEQEVIEGVKSHIGGYGIKIVRLGNFNVAINPEDEQRLNEYYSTEAGVEQAARLQGKLGAYQQMAQIGMMKDAGKGMATGGGDGNPMLTGAGLGMGMAMANMFGQMGNNQAQQAPAQQPVAQAAQVAAPTLEERLKKLKSLKDAGLIEDEEYQSKRAEILKDL